MTSGRQRRRPAFGITTKLVVPLLVGLIVLVALNSGGLDNWRSLEVAALVTFALLLVFSVVDNDLTFSRMNEDLSDGFGELEKSLGLLNNIRASAVDTDLLTEFVQSAGELDQHITPLLQQVAHREIARLNHFVQQVAVGNEIAYNGEDREWLLGLTENVTRSIDAISLSTVDAGMRGFDGGLWTSDLGSRYLEEQRDAIRRGVRIRRIFIVETPELARDEVFQGITQMQRDVGIEVRMLDQEVIPEDRRTLIFDFIVFDQAVTYESTTAASFPSSRPAIVRTLLTPSQDQIENLDKLFEELWEAANPDRPVT